MSIFQLGAVCFALFMIYVLSIHSKKKILSSVEQSFWYTVWVVFILASLFPNLLQGITGFLRFARLFDLMNVLALMVLTVLVFFSYFAQKDIHHKMEELARKMSMESLQKETEHKKKK